MECWAVISTVRLKESKTIADAVLKTDCNLAIAVNGRKDIFNQLDPLQRKHPNKFKLVLGEFKESVDATNYIYGILRKRDPKKNIFCMPIPDDLQLRDGWFGALGGCLGNIKNGVGVVAGDDGRSGANLVGFGGLTAKYCDLHQKGWLLCPVYIHWFLDHEISPIAKKLGVYHACKGAKAWHTMIDHKKNERKKEFRLDERRFVNRQKLNFTYKDIPEAPWRHWK